VGELLFLVAGRGSRPILGQDAWWEIKKVHKTWEQKESNPGSSKDRGLRLLPVQGE